MAKRRTRMSKAKSSKAPSSEKSAPRREPGAAHLHELIGELIAAKQRGDDAASGKAVSALDSLRKGRASAPVRQAAAEAHAVAGNPVLRESTRMLGNIAARLRAHA